MDRNERRAEMNLIDYYLTQMGLPTEFNTTFFQKGPENPMHDPEIVAKMKATIARTGSHKATEEDKLRIKKALQDSVLIQSFENAIQAGRGSRYIMINPNGFEEYTPFPVVWSRERGLSASHLRGVAKGERRHHKEYRCRFATVDEIVENELAAIKGILWEDEIKEHVKNNLKKFEEEATRYKMMDRHQPQSSLGQKRTAAQKKRISKGTLAGIARKRKQNAKAQKAQIC